MEEKRIRQRGMTPRQRELDDMVTVAKARYFRYQEQLRQNARGSEDMVTEASRASEALQEAIQKMRISMHQFQRGNFWVFYEARVRFQRPWYRRLKARYKLYKMKKQQSEYCPCCSARTTEELLEWAIDLVENSPGDLQVPSRQSLRTRSFKALSCP
ncbi:hypothetical protein PVAG01_01930 [Phlyctema vagabunda]|uniref:Uncharacterized protein n=1 Tax=Phlyctema vagabunda TaxID=108571 RepID=A0ABR4PZG4_9HELO